MRATNITDEDSETSVKRTVLLEIPPRLQWENDNGYCGETAIQSFGLYYGAWISQKLIRTINKGEYLFHPQSVDDCRDPTRTLTILHFTYDEWDWKNSQQPQFRKFCYWMKRSILRRHPVMFGIYLLYMQCHDYDHIVPAVGLQYEKEDEYSPDDVLIYYNFFHEKQLGRKMNEDDLGSTRRKCRMHCGQGGCIPLDVDYGIAVTGILDDDKVTQPVRLSVSAWNEPNPHPAYGEDPTEMDGIVTIDDLTIGNSYVLLRYSSYEYVPTKGETEAFLRSNFDEKHEFTAIETTYIYNDPKKILSTGSVYYRCVRNPERIL